MSEKEIKTVEYTGIGEVTEANEKDLLAGLLKAAEFKSDPTMQKKIVINRKGETLFSFSIRPISEDEVLKARKKATKYMPNPAGKQLPPIEKEVDYVKLRSWKVYFATVDEDKKKIWGNDALKQKLNVIEDVDTIDALLTGGEKDAVSDQIDAISNYNVDLDEYAKN